MPFGELSSFDVSYTKSTGGPANTSPGQAPSSIPFPTIIVCAGSWPEPEPWMIETLSSRRHVGPIDQVVLRLVLERAAAGELDPGQHLGDELTRVVDELLHAWASGELVYFSRQAALMACRITPIAVAPASTDPRLRSPV